MGYNGRMRREITFVSEFDGTERRAILVAPDDAGREALPLVIVPHAAGWDEVMTADYWRDAPVRHGVIAIFPHGHSRKLDLRSLAWRGQISDMASFPRMIEDLGYPVDRSRIYAAGISMGGMESLVLAGKHPDLLAGVVSFNGVIDLAAWFYDCAPDVCGRMEFEMGGTPEQVPEEYAARSPINYSATIAKVPVLMYWDPDDKIVQFQEEKQSGRLYRLVKEIDPNAPMEGRRHDKGHTFVNPGLALTWLMEHRKGE
jgi:dipeptidyl aminopeptidase/acylaminoacyl peptidase